MSEYRFERFLEDPVQYYALTAYWNNLWEKLVESTGKAGLWSPPADPARFANGTLVMDGNPILAAESVPLRKAVRIIQHDAPRPDRLIEWKDERWNERAGPLEELVLCLYLDVDTEAQAQRRLAAWLAGDCVVEWDEQRNSYLPRTVPNRDAAFAPSVAAERGFRRCFASAAVRFAAVSDHSRNPR